MKITHFTYLLKTIAVTLAILAICNTNIDNIATYLLTSFFSMGIAVLLWLLADVLEDVRLQREQAYTVKTPGIYSDNSTEQQKGA
jgi:hypothetical protein